MEGSLQLSTVSTYPNDLQSKSEGKQLIIIVAALAFFIENKEIFFFL